MWRGCVTRHSVTGMDALLNASYNCPVCGHAHNTSSRIGYRHRQYATPNGFGLVDRRSDRIVSSFHGENALRRAPDAADAHVLTGYLSVCVVDSYGHFLTGNLR